jgi:hypothetical protein
MDVYEFESGEKTLEEHWEEVKERDGEKLVLPEPGEDSFRHDYNENLKGFVIDGNLDFSIKEAIHGYIYPLKVGGNIFERMIAKSEIAKAKMVLKAKNVLNIIYYDADCMTWAVSFIDVSDLFKNPNDLLDEAVDARVSKKHDLAYAKEAAFCALTGIQDLH